VGFSAFATGSDEEKSFENNWPKKPCLGFSTLSGSGRVGAGREWSTPDTAATGADPANEAWVSSLATSSDFGCSTRE
jgi:hypothetical protein